jgi:hypothetical protein
MIMVTQIVTVVTAVDDDQNVYTWVLPGKVEGWLGDRHAAAEAVYTLLEAGIALGVLRDDMPTYVTHHELPLPEVY